MVRKRVREHLRSDNGPEFVARDLRNWLEGTDQRCCILILACPGENGYCESFDSKVRDKSGGHRGIPPVKICCQDRRARCLGSFRNRMAFWRGTGPIGRSLSSSYQRKRFVPVAHQVSPITKNGVPSAV